MKIALIALTVITLTLFMALLSFKSAAIETPQYSVVRSLGEVEIRRYPPMVVAKTNLQGTSYKDNSSQGFRTIANYIFGGNVANQKIAMTAPVVMTMGDSASMYFVMPRQYARNQLPQPGSPAVRITEEGAKTLAVIRFGGYADDQKIEAHCRQLEKMLKQNQIRTRGSFLYMGYNAPWDFIHRRNEVAIEVVEQE